MAISLASGTADFYPENPVIHQIPGEKSLDSTLALKRDPYGFISKRCHQYQSDLFEIRLMFQRTICMRGKECVQNRRTIVLCRERSPVLISGRCGLGSDTLTTPTKAPAQEKTRSWFHT
jgi:hypothetical protein